MDVDHTLSRQRCFFAPIDRYQFTVLIALHRKHDVPDDERLQMVTSQLLKHRFNKQRRIVIDRFNNGQVADWREANANLRLCRFAAAQMTQQIRAQRFL
ncbi:MAG: hypothetical protein BGO65_12085 [Afipia sp. 64-13]|nr:MAG: hypothetical protein BGO65_12085 [Afipia sp. 64-13]